MAITVPAVTNREIAAPTGNFVNVHACTKPSMLNGAGSEKALPSTACSPDLNAMETVTYSGSSTVTEHRMRSTVPDQFTRSIFEWVTPRSLSRGNSAPGVAVVNAGCVVIRVHSFRASKRVEEVK